MAALARQRWQNGDGGGEWLEDGDFGIDARAAQKDRLDGLGNAVAADFLRSIVRENAND
jgi:hypothetical protein